MMEEDRFSEGHGDPRIRGICSSGCLTTLVSLPALLVTHSAVNQYERLKRRWYDLNGIPYEDRSTAEFNLLYYQRIDRARRG